MTLNISRRDWYTPDQLADALNVSVKTIYRRLASGDLRGVRIGGPRGRIRIGHADAEAFVRGYMHGVVGEWSRALSTSRCSPAGAPSSFASPVPGAPAACLIERR